MSNLVDAVLQDVADSLRKCLRAFDLVYRLGGEEFLVLLPGVDTPEAASVAEGLRVAVAAEPHGTLPAGSRYRPRCARSGSRDELGAQRHAGCLSSEGQPDVLALDRVRRRDAAGTASGVTWRTSWRPAHDCITPPTSDPSSICKRIREVPADLVCADGHRLSVLVNASIALSPSGRPSAIRASLFDATDRHRHERELVDACDVERARRARVERLQRISAEHLSEGATFPFRDRAPRSCGPGTADPVNPA
jgi:GGDEF domain-containing protein